MLLGPQLGCIPALKRGVSRSVPFSKDSKEETFSDCVNPDAAGDTSGSKPWLLWTGSRKADNSLGILSRSQFPTTSQLRPFRCQPHLGTSYKCVQMHVHICIATCQYKQTHMIHTHMGTIACQRIKIHIKICIISRQRMQIHMYTCIIQIQIWIRMYAHMHAYIHSIIQIQEGREEGIYLPRYPIQQHALTFVGFTFIFLHISLFVDTREMGAH
mmetsp:Transcript_55999/g.93022  ORF Transcript_55999/g.93022 Transcript_55999/m.93022 type:complete len:214 (+) Transcript_55999:112-753(+)